LRAGLALGADEEQYPPSGVEGDWAAAPLEDEEAGGAQSELDKRRDKRRRSAPLPPPPLVLSGHAASLTPY